MRPDTFPTFTYNGRPHRIVGMWRNEWERGYVEPERVRYNVLRRRFLWFWIEVERERIPSWAWIESATLGTCAWRSDLMERFGR